MTNPRPIASNTIACVALCFAGLLFTARTAGAAAEASIGGEGGGWALCRTADSLAGTELRTGTRQGQAHCLPLRRRAERHLARIRALYEGSRSEARLEVHRHRR